MGRARGLTLGRCGRAGLQEFQALMSEIMPPGLATSKKRMSQLFREVRLRAVYRQGVIACVG